MSVLLPPCCLTAGGAQFPLAVIAAILATSNPNLVAPRKKRKEQRGRERGPMAAFFQVKSLIAGTGTGRARSTQVF